MIWIELYLTLLTLAGLSINAFNDIKTRYASLRVWLVQIIGSLVGIFIYQITDGFEFVTLITMSINIALGFLIFVLTLYLGLWGGGDAIGILALSFSVPFIFSYIPIPDMYSFFPPIIFLITNLILGILLCAMYFLVYNLWLKIQGINLFLETQGGFFAKMVLLITSKQIPPTEIKKKMFYDPMEEYTNEIWQIKTSFLMPDLDDDELEELEQRTRLQVKADALQSKRSYIWHRYQVPGIVAFLIGFVYWVFFGSPLVIYLDLIS